MNSERHDRGNMSNAIEPQAQPTTTPSDLVAVEASSVDRILAAAAHLGMFAGFWFLAPLAIYFWKKDESRFVAFHAAQALMLCFLQIAVSMLGLFCYLIGTIIVVAVAGATKSGPLVLVTWALVTLVMVTAALAPTVLSLIGGFHAFQGRTWKMPLVGRMVERWLLKHDTERTNSNG